MSVPVTTTGAVAFVAVTVSVDVSPEKIVVGFAVIETLRTGANVTVTVAWAVIIPPGPVAVAV